MTRERDCDSQKEGKKRKRCQKIQFGSKLLWLFSMFAVENLARFKVHTKLGSEVNPNILFTGIFCC